MEGYKVNKEDVPEQYRDIVELLGLEKFLELCELLGGSLVYVPTLKSMLQEGRNREICKRFNGGNFGQLAREYRLSERRVRKIIEESRERTQERRFEDG